MVVLVVLSLWLTMFSGTACSAKAVLAQNIAKKMAEIDEDNRLDNLSDDSDDDEDNHHPDEENKDDEDSFDVNANLAMNNSPAKPKNRNRRASVSSESLDPSKIKEQLSQVTIIPKDQETMQILFNLVSKSAMLRRMLDPEERTLIIKAFAGPISVPAGEVIIKQGNHPDNLCVLAAAIMTTPRDVQ